MFVSLKRTITGSATAACLILSVGLASAAGPTSDAADEALSPARSITRSLTLSPSEPASTTTAQAADTGALAQSTTKEAKPAAAAKPAPLASRNASVARKPVRVAAKRLALHRQVACMHVMVQGVTY